MVEKALRSQLAGSRGCDRDHHDTRRRKQPTRCRADRSESGPKRDCSRARSSARCSSAESMWPCIAQKTCRATPPPGLEICAALPRARGGRCADHEERSDALESLPKGATIATGSVRRHHQLRWLRPDLQIVDLRGNVPTRLRKLTENPWDGDHPRACRSGAAGLRAVRAESLHSKARRCVARLLPTNNFCRPAGRAIVALQVRADDESTRVAVAAINHDETLLCLRAERDFCGAARRLRHARRRARDDRGWTDDDARAVFRPIGARRPHVGNGAR